MPSISPLLDSWHHQCFNLVDSMDGLAIGLAAIASAFFMLVTVDAGQESLAYLSAILLGSAVGASYFNIMPARSFLGDAGSQFLGFLLAALAIAYTPPGLPQPSSWFVPILLLAVPIFDTTLVVISRMRQGISIYKADRPHLSQPCFARHVSAMRSPCTWSHPDRLRGLYGIASPAPVG
jgi:UDP-GlcNAc:undecaprenyl-phosphate GlcNAc-1-phosphate transferase